MVRKIFAWPLLFSVAFNTMFLFYLTPHVFAIDYSKINYNWSSTKTSSDLEGKSVAVGTNLFVNTTFTDENNKSHTQVWKFTNTIGLGYHMAKSAPTISAIPGPGGSAYYSSTENIKGAPVYLYILSPNSSTEDGKSISFSDSNTGVYYLWVEGKTDSNGNVSSWQAKKIVVKMDQNEFNQSDSNNFWFSTGIAEDRTNPYWKTASIPSMSGALSAFIAKANSGWLPHEIGAGGNIFGPPNKIPQKCKAMLIGPMWKVDNAPLKELLTAKGSVIPFDYPKDVDEELYKAFYSDLDPSSNNFYSDKHVDLATFQTYAQAADNALSTADIWNDPTLENPISKAAETLFGGPIQASASSVGITQGAKATVGGGEMAYAAGSKVAQGFKSAYLKVFQREAASVGSQITQSQVAAAEAMPSSIEMAGFSFDGAGQATALASTTAEATSAGGYLSTFSASGAGFAGPIALVGSLAIMAEVGMIDKFKQEVSQDGWNAEVKAIAADIYMRNHIAFHSCMVAEGVTGGGFTKEILGKEITQTKNAETQLAGLLDMGNTVNNNTNQCPVPSGINIANPLEWIKSALCSVGVILGEIANWLLTKAFNLLQDVLGT